MVRTAPSRNNAWISCWNPTRRDAVLQAIHGVCAHRGRRRRRPTYTAIRCIFVGELAGTAEAVICGARRPDRKRGAGGKTERGVAEVVACRSESGVAWGSEDGVLGMAVFLTQRWPLR